MYKSLEKIVEILAWIFIVLVFLVLGAGVGFVLNYVIGGLLGMVVASIAGVIVAIMGVRIANKAYKNKGTLYLLSRTSTSRNLDDKIADEEEVTG